MLAAIATAALPCTPVAGAEALWAGKNRFIFVGETHGTREVPALFADLVCDASRRRRPVIVAVEQSEQEQPAIDAFLTSDGGSVAQRAFLASPIWTGPFKDGRSSQAYLDLFERLRQMKRAGRVARVVAFQPVLRDPAAVDIAVNQGMADIIIAAAARTAPEALVLAYTGSVHAMRRPVTFRTTFSPAAALTPPEATISLIADGDLGTAWNCQEPCGPHPNGSPNGPHPRGVTLRSVDPDDRGRPAFDGVVFVGGPVSASPPAVPASK